MSIVWPYPVHSHYDCGSFHSNMGSSPVSGQGPSADKEQGQGPLCEMLCHIKPDLQSHLVLVSDSCERVYLNTFKILSNNNFCFCRNLRTSSAYVEYHRRILINHSTEKLLRSPTMDLNGASLMSVGTVLTDVPVWCCDQIRVNSVNPTVVMTEMGRLGWSDPEKAKSMTSRIPLGRFAGQTLSSHTVLQQQLNTLSFHLFILKYSNVSSRTACGSYPFDYL